MTTVEQLRKPNRKFSYLANAFAYCCLFPYKNRRKINRYLNQLRNS